MRLVVLIKKRVLRVEQQPVFDKQVAHKAHLDSTLKRYKKLIILFRIWSENNQIIEKIFSVHKINHFF